MGQLRGSATDPLGNSQSRNDEGCGRAGKDEWVYFHRAQALLEANRIPSLTLFLLPSARMESLCHLSQPPWQLSVAMRSDLADTFGEVS